jgi:hypothetical protein
MSEAYRTWDEVLAESAVLRVEKVAQAALIATLQTQVTTRLARVAALERRAPPPWLKPNRPAAPPPRPEHADGPTVTLPVARLHGFIPGRDQPPTA